MEVKLIDYTGCGTPDPARHAANVLVFTKNTRLNMVPGLMAQIAARPWEKIETELNYMANTIPSSWEFVDYTFLINGVTRAFTHQFVRTRTASFAQQTMRVLNVKGWEYGTGPTIAGDQRLKCDYDDQMRVISHSYDNLIKHGAKIEDARGILPTNILTNIVAKFNLRSLSETARKRASSRTQGEYRDVLEAMLGEVKRVHPWASLFFNRTFDVSAKELENEILNLDLTDEHRTRLVKLIDQLRSSV